jgi:uncharacterized protein involved in outer membrane biogenesis
LKSPTYFRPILKILGIALLSASACLLLVTFFYGAEIKKLLLQNINQHLNSEIQVSEIEFSVIRHFPFASVELKDIVAKDAGGKIEKDTLLKAGKVSLLFNLMGVFNKDVAIKKIILKDATVNVRVDKNGDDNYHFWKSVSGGESPVIDLENVVLDNVRVTYAHEGADQHYVFNSIHGTLHGKFSNDQFELRANADLVSEHLYAGKLDYAHDKKIRLRSVLHVNSTTGTYEFADSQIRVADLWFDISGKICSLADATNLDLKINSNEVELRNMLSLLPPSLTEYFSGFDAKGKIIFKSTVTGYADKKHSPDLSLSFSLANGSLSPKETEVVLNGLSLNGSFEKKESKPAVLSINAFNGKLNGRTVSGNLTVRDFENPYLTINTKADLDLNSLRAFIRHDTLESLSGLMKVNISFAGKVKDLKQYARNGNYQSDASGTIVLEDVSLKLKQNPLLYRNISGTFLLHDNNVEIQALNGFISSTDFHITGSLHNFITFLLIPNQEANMNMAMSSSLINLDEILENKSGTAVEDTSYKIKINPRLVCNMNISADKLVFRKFEATDIKGNVHIEDQLITSPDLHFNAMEGSVSMSASVATHRRDSVLMSCKAKVSGVNITTLFIQMENFGEQTVTDKNLKGKVTADVVFNSSWSKDLTINPSKVTAQADITIDNGELNDFKPVLSLSKYLKLADLKHISFSTLKNQIQIRDRKIYFPSMEIKSSALNLTASGTHDFDNMVDYKLNMLLSDVMGKKVKSNETEFGVVEDDGLGHTKLFIAMKGPVDDPKFSYDKKAVSEKIAQDFRADRKNMKGMLNEEFGVFKKDPTVKVEKKKKKEEMQIDWEN